MTTTNHTNRPTPRRTTRISTLIAGILSAVCICAGLGLLAYSPTEPPPPSAVEDLHGNPVRIDGGELPPAPVIEEMNVQHVAGARVTVPKAGMSVSLSELSAVDGQITPPGFTEIYHVRNMGVRVDDAPHGTVYIVAHSVTNGFAPGNAVMDSRRGESILQTGDTIDVDGVAYNTDESFFVPKDELPYRGDVWENVPGRLVFITCLERDGVATGDNLIITATMA
ncbi:class F sortase [Corynebacteriaceae bacterium 7-707]